MHFKWLSGKPGNDEEKEDTQTRNLRACLATAILHNGKGSLLVLALRHLDAGAQRHGCHDFWLQFWPSSGPTAAAQQWTWTQFLHIFSHMKALESAKDANFPSPVSSSNPPLSTFSFFLRSKVSNGSCQSLWPQALGTRLLQTELCCQENAHWILKTRRIKGQGDTLQ